MNLVDHDFIMININFKILKIETIHLTIYPKFNEEMQIFVVHVCSCKSYKY